MKPYKENPSKCCKEPLREFTTSPRRRAVRKRAGSWAQNALSILLHSSCFLPERRPGWSIRKRAFHWNRPGFLLPHEVFEEIRSRVRLWETRIPESPAKPWFPRARNPVVSKFFCSLVIQKHKVQILCIYKEIIMICFLKKSREWTGVVSRLKSRHVSDWLNKGRF